MEASAVVILHLFYIPLSEERGLERRFGEDYGSTNGTSPAGSRA